MRYKINLTLGTEWKEGKVRLPWHINLCQAAIFSSQAPILLSVAGASFNEQISIHGVNCTQRRARWAISTHSKRVGKVLIKLDSTRALNVYLWQLRNFLSDTTMHNTKPMNNNCVYFAAFLHSLGEWMFIYTMHLHRSRSRELRRDTSRCSASYGPSDLWPLLVYPGRAFAPTRAPLT